MFPVGATGLLLEVVEGEEHSVWRAVDRHRPGTWDAVEAAVTEAEADELRDMEDAVLLVTTDGVKHRVRLSSDAERRRQLRTIGD